jgi:hypothetical protein
MALNLRDELIGFVQNAFQHTIEAALRGGCRNPERARHPDEVGAAHLAEHDRIF